MNAEYHHKMLWTICIHCDTQKIRLCVSSLMKTAKKHIFTIWAQCSVGSSTVQYSTGSVLDGTGHFSSVLDCIQSSTQYRSSTVQSSIQYSTIQYPVQRKSSTQYRLSNTVHIEYSTLQYAVRIQDTGTAVRSIGSNTDPVKTTIVDVLTFCIHWNIQNPWPPKPQKHVSTIRIQPNPRMAMIDDHYHRMSSRLSIHDTMQNTQFAKRWHI